MAYLSRLTTPFNGMDRIYNVSERVGPFQECFNNPTDVELVQFLLLSAINRTNVPGTEGMARPLVNGRYDAVTGFWIYRFQDGMKRHGAHTVVDGVVSPARAVSFGSHDYTIVWLNSQYLGAYGEQAFVGLAQNTQLSSDLRSNLTSQHPQVLHR